MTYTTHLKGAALAAICAVTLVACEGGMPAPTSPSAVVGSGGAASNPDGTTVKATIPVGLSPTNNATGTSLTPTLSAQAGVGKYGTGAIPHRFQISTSESFETIAQSGIGTFDAQGIVRYVVPTALTTGTKYYWRTRPEAAEDQTGTWSATVAFTTTGTVVPPPRADVPGEKRTPNPPAGQTLPLPDMRGELAKFGNASDSCPQGLQYVLNPWLIRVIDHFRTIDTRWGFNAKPTRTANDNKGVPVVAAGDEGAYNPTSLADEGNTSPLLVDMLVSHCGNPVIGWRVFTGEEPGRWTGAGRF
jgi:hypothetical protein